MSSSVVNWEPTPCAVFFPDPQGLIFTQSSVFQGCAESGRILTASAPWAGVRSHAAVWRHPPPYVPKTFIKHFREQWQKEKHSLEAEIVCKGASGLLGSAARNGARSQRKLCSKGWIMEAREPEA